MYRGDFAMSEQDLYARAEAAASKIGAHVGAMPKTAVVLGSGLGGLAQQLVDPVALDYAEIPHFPVTTVAGHSGRFAVGGFHGPRVALLQGRFHYYEGHPLEIVTFPMRVLQRLGVTRVILTAAVGGINTSLTPGNLVCLVDHLNLLGENPLRGPNDERLGIRFPDMTEAYSRRLRQLALEEARHGRIPLKTGVYACMPGPSYETPAEIRMLRTLGADVVGMSTVAEAMVAHHGGIEVLALAVVTNAAAGVTGAPITHEEVLEMGKEAVTRLSNLIGRVVNRLEESG
jgi:purine-nucleoside phosphorylase